MTVRPDLGDWLALALIEHGPSSGSVLSSLVGARKGTVLRELRSNPRFERVGGGRTTTWRLVSHAWEPQGTDCGRRAGIDDLAGIAQRQGALERRVAALERLLASQENGAT